MQPEVRYELNGEHCNPKSDGTIETLYMEKRLRPA